MSVLPRKDLTDTAVIAIPLEVLAYGTLTVIPLEHTGK